MGYELLRARARGESHVRSDTPCEDYGLKREHAGIKLFALSDGHGDKNCPRSDIGSRRACEIAVNELMTFAEQLAELDASRNDNGCSLLDYGKSEQEALVRQLITSIIGKWASDVIANVREQPLTVDERNGCAQRYLTAYDNNERLEHIYGATLIAGVATERYLLLIQQGDGRCEVFWGDGSVTQPIPWDNRCTANVTTSLCDADAIPSTRYHVIDLTKEEVIAVLAGSDGVEDAFFSMDGTHNFYRSLLARAADTSVSDLENWLLDYLPEFSKNGTGGYGSQDDVTICGFIDTEKVKPLIRKMELDSKTVSLRSGIKNIDDRLASMGSGKLEHLQARLAEAVAEEESARKTRDLIVVALEANNANLEATQKAGKATKLELMADGVPMIGLSDRRLKVLLNNLVHSYETKMRELELKLPGVEQRLVDAQKRIEPIRQELQRYTDRRRELLELRDAYQRDLDEISTEDTAEKSISQDVPEDDLAEPPSEKVIEAPRMPNELDTLEPRPSNGDNSSSENSCGEMPDSVSASICSVETMESDDE